MATALDKPHLAADLAVTLDNDRPGTLARISAILGAARIGISSVIQPEGHEGDSVPLILMIHDATNAAMNKALARIRQLNVIKGAPAMIRVENFE